LNCPNARRVIPANTVHHANNARRVFPASKAHRDLPASTRTLGPDALVQRSQVCNEVQKIQGLRGIRGGVAIVAGQVAKGLRQARYTWQRSYRRRPGYKGIGAVMAYMERSYRRRSGYKGIGAGAAYVASVAIVRGQATKGSGKSWHTWLALL